MNKAKEIYYVDYGAGTVYYHVIDGIVTKDGKPLAISFDKFLDYIATAKELGHKAGRL